MEYCKANFHADMGSWAAPAFLSMVCLFNTITPLLLLHRILEFWKHSLLLINTSLN